MGQILVGTCAFADHEHFYPAGLKPQERLAYYSRRFPVVEIDATYYAPLPARTFARWASLTPPSFRFGVKAYRALTLHDRGNPRLTDKRALLDAFLTSVAPLAQAGKLQYLLFQFPPWFVRGRDSEEYLYELSAAVRGYLLAVEFRHASWWQGEGFARTADLLRRLSLVHVAADEPQAGRGSVPFVPLVTHPELAILRLHGRNRATWAQKGLRSSGERFRYRYDQAELSDLLGHARRLAEHADTVDVLFNNNHADWAVRNAEETLALLGSTLAPATLFGAGEGTYQGAGERGQGREGHGDGSGTGGTSQAPGDL
jgi:uncharacterized protein YecE (DUF72 family)